MILTGQNELWDKLRQQRYAAIRQRIDINCEIPQYDRSRIQDYIQAHMQYATGALDIFTDKAGDEVYQYSAGSARAIKKGCTHCLMNAVQRNKKLVDDHTVRAVITGELP